LKVRLCLENETAGAQTRAITAALCIVLFRGKIGGELCQGNAFAGGLHVAYGIAHAYEDVLLELPQCDGASVERELRLTESCFLPDTTERIRETERGDPGGALRVEGTGERTRAAEIFPAEPEREIQIEKRLQPVACLRQLQPCPLDTGARVPELRQVLQRKRKRLLDRRV